MTASITAFGLVPLLFASGPGSEIQRPLAIVVIGGLITATALTLILLPVLYLRFAHAPGAAAQEEASHVLSAVRFLSAPAPAGERRFPLRPADAPRAGEPARDRPRRLCREAAQAASGGPVPSCWPAHCSPALLAAAGAADGSAVA